MINEKIIKYFQDIYKDYDISLGNVIDDSANSIVVVKYGDGRLMRLFYHYDSTERGNVYNLKDILFKLFFTKEEKERYYDVELEYLLRIINIKQILK